MQLISDHTYCIPSTILNLGYPKPVHWFPLAHLQVVGFAVLNCLSASKSVCMCVCALCSGLASYPGWSLRPPSVTGLGSSSTLIMTMMLQSQGHRWMNDWKRSRPKLSDISVLVRIFGPRLKKQAHTYTRKQSLVKTLNHFVWMMKQCSFCSHQQGFGAFYTSSIPVRSCNVRIFFFFTSDITWEIYYHCAVRKTQK